VIKAQESDHHDWSPIGLVKVSAFDSKDFPGEVVI
jgi:hypothetical protein